MTTDRGCSEYYMTGRSDQQTVGVHHSSVFSTQSTARRSSMTSQPYPRYDTSRSVNPLIVSRIAHIRERKCLKVPRKRIRTRTLVCRSVARPIFHSSRITPRNRTPPYTVSYLPWLSARCTGMDQPTIGYSYSTIKTLPFLIGYHRLAWSRIRVVQSPGSRYHH